MANEEHLAILKQGVDAWNDWRGENPDVRPDLWRADLRGANLSGTNLRRAYLSGTNLRRANLSGANLRRAYLSGANLRRAYLSGADLRGANLADADLSGADLSGANLRRAYLSGADLRGANLAEADLRRAYLTGADLSKANLSRADLSAAYLSGVSLVQTDLKKAVLNGCRIYGISAWDLELDEDTKQDQLIITPGNEPAITVDNLEVAQFIYLLLNNQKLRHVIDTITSKVVLILGRFTPARKAVLDLIREEVRKYDLLPVMFDFDPPASRNLMETVTTLARLSRFVIADITDPRSVIGELEAAVKALPSVIFLPVLQESHKPWGMFGDLADYDWVLPPVKYSDAQDVSNSVAGWIELVKNHAQKLDRKRRSRRKAFTV